MVAPVTVREFTTYLANLPSEMQDLPLIAPEAYWHSEVVGVSLGHQGEVVIQSDF